MALIIEKETSYGINANYFKISAVQADFMQNKLNIQLLGWVSKEARQSNKSPLTTNTIACDVEFTFTDNLVAKGYEFLKSTPDFADAEDD